MFETDASDLCAAPVLDLAAAHAGDADRTRTVEPEVVAAVRDSGLLALSATRSLGGSEASVTRMARELEALAAACA